MTTITATPEATLGRMRLNISNTSGGSVYVFRRNALGVAAVREAQVGLSGATLTVYDYEAQQGTAATDYIVTNVDGVQQATVQVTVPDWGSWLKAPGMPWLNVRVRPEKPGSETYGARRTVVEVEGSDYPVVLSQIRRAAAGDGVALACLSTAEVDSIRAVLASGDTVLLDTPGSWGFPWRYVNVGDVEVARVWDDGLGLDIGKRLVRLGGLVAAAVPTINVSIAQGVTYATVAAGYPSYAAIPPIRATYALLAANG